MWEGLAMETTSRKVLIAVAVVFLLAPASTLTLAIDAQADRMENAFTEWVGKHSVESANLVIVRDGAILGTVGRGRLATSRPVGVASLSKAITGVCVVKLVEAHKLQFDADLGAVLAGRFKRHPPKDQRAQTITIAQLLTHTSGITNDPSQGIAFNQFQPFDKPSMDKQFDVALSVPLGYSPGSRYFYNNMNYAALAVVIETVTGEKYGDYCGREVLKKAGVNDATLKWEWASRGAYGGWKISPEGYAKFLDYFDPSQKLLSTPPVDWPRFENRAGRGYSIGTNTRNGADFFHYGDFTWSNPRASYGAYYAMWHQGVRFVVTYTPNISHELVDELDAALYRAAFQ
jgi:CubicO group peptidase (beta-lactamase class C family)